MDSILEARQGVAAIITLNRPDILNAWNAPMRALLLAAIRRAEQDGGIRAIILTGAGERAFCAGQDLNEVQSYDADGAEAWIGEWEELYGTVRALSKPFIIALNGLAAGSAFQLALLADFRVGHDGVRMGQPEINAGIASITGPWIMREILGLARTIDLTLTGRLMDAEECFRVGLINRLVPRERVLSEALALAEELARKDADALRIDKQWFREMTEPGFKDTIAAAVRFHRELYGAGVSAANIAQFLEKKKQRGASNSQ